MIQESFDFIRRELNDYLSLKLGVSAEPRVVLGDVLKVYDGNNNDGLSNKIIVSLINIEEDKISKNPENFLRDNKKIFYKNPALHLNIYVLFSINKDSYGEALKQVSLVIQFFQKNNVFSNVNFPLLPAEINKLIFDLHTMGFEESNHLWATLGGKYIPSVVYKMRLITIDDSPQSQGAVVKQIHIEGKYPTKI